MPHRTTYFFPRQFPDRSFDASKKQLLGLGGHENEITKESSFNAESDVKALRPAPTKEIATAKKHSVASSDLFTGDNKFQSRKQFSAFCDWLVEKKGERSSSSHVKLRLQEEDDDHELLLPAPAHSPEPVHEVIAGKDRNFDRPVSLQRLSSGSSYAGSLFSGTTLDGNFSEVKDSSQLSTTTETTRRREEDEESRKSLAQRTRESYYLQLTLAKRLTSQASLATDPMPLQDGGSEGPGPSFDAETVSYRLWVSGCLSYTDKISDGFYNILGMNPYLWMMCNEFEEGRRLPSLMSA
ncbi:hypothetical protein L1049_026511 [Liquidambar formosana]|uniref:EDR1/CTR1/ARMC3-like peptidase-like domain-containing protein n=1 Tax=Liquidambar formosana TaxID=63359 RepID=A0AAP0NGJ6_LIQFO